MHLILLLSTAMILAPSLKESEVVGTYSFKAKYKTKASREIISSEILVVSIRVKSSGEFYARYSDGLRVTGEWELHGRQIRLFPEIKSSSNISKWKMRIYGLGKKGPKFRERRVERFISKDGKKKKIIIRAKAKNVLFEPLDGD